MQPLKLKLDRTSLETMYKSFVFPVMEYALPVWGGTYDSDINKLESIHVDAMRLISGATARSNIRNLYQETAWQSFRERRDYSLLTMMYRIKNGSAPDYLKNLLPRENQNHINCNLRNNKNLKLPFIRLESFRRSFIPFAVKLWNNLTIEHRETATLEEFKSVIKRDYQDVNLLYYYGKRWPAVHHTRIRLGCSKLNADPYFM